MKKQNPVKYIFVLGGVISGLGKGIAAASIGYLLKSSGLKVNILKLSFLKFLKILKSHFFNFLTFIRNLKS